MTETKPSYLRKSQRLPGARLERCPLQRAVLYAFALFTELTAQWSMINEALQAPGQA